MTEQEVLVGLEEIALASLGARVALSPADRLVEDLRLDSLQLLTLLVEIENRFAVSLSEGDEAGLATVADLIAAVRRKVG